MKKILCFVLLIIIILLIGCSEDDIENNENSLDEQLVDIIDNTLILRIGEKYIFDIEDKIIIFVENNTTLKSNDEEKSITGIKVGNTQIKISLIENPNVSKTITIKVKDIHDHIYVNGKCECGRQDLYIGKTLRKVEGMLDVLAEINSNNSDIGVMDSIMAGYYIKEKYNDELMIVPDLALDTEDYGIAARKDGAYTIKMINKALVDLAKTGAVDALAAQYGLTESLCIDKEAMVDLSDETGKADWEEIVASGKLKIGFTYYTPIAFININGDFVGFDTDLARLVADYYNLEVEFIEIEWSQKVGELNKNKIDLIWNGMLITDEMKDRSSVSMPYLKNKQVVVIKTEDKEIYKSLEDMYFAIVAVEYSSKSQFCVEKDED